jgi:hypothetical protein
MQWLFSSNPHARFILRRILPVSLALGAGAEFFMLNTGFYNTLVKNEAEKRLAEAREEAQYWNTRREREKNAGNLSKGVILHDRQQRFELLERQGKNIL